MCMKKILVSQCLYGDKPVRYDGKTKEERDPRFIRWKEENRLIPVCPEVDGGLPVPRTDAQRIGDQVITRDGRDVTKEYRRGAEIALERALQEEVLCAVLKEKSPSCGSNKVYDGTFEGNLIDGQGITVQLLREAGGRVYSEEELDLVEQMVTGRENIILTGMPACGKSVTGVVLAKSLQMNFLDTDLLIQEAAGKSLQEIINEDGMEVFKALEEQVLCGVSIAYGHCDWRQCGLLSKGDGASEEAGAYRVYTGLGGNDTAAAQQYHNTRRCYEQGSGNKRTLRRTKAVI